MYKYCRDNAYYAELLQSDGMSRGFCKTASAIPDVLAEEISKIRPEKDKIFLVIAPMGMGEYWGPNVNGDFFPEKSLRNDTMDYGHKTFLEANIFRHHINKDPKIGFGRPIVSCIDEPQKRVVTITMIDVPRARQFGALEFLEMISRGELPDVSMGCRVPYDVCSICGKKSKTPAEYCEHLRPENILKTDEMTGKIACAINDYPKFFDLSFVHRGADRSSGTLHKISADLSSIQNNRRSFFLPAGLSFSKAAEDKSASLKDGLMKVASAPISSSFFEKNDLWKREKIDPLYLNKLAAEHPMEVLGTFFSMGVPLRADELQYISLERSGQSKLALDCYLNGHLFLPDFDQIEIKKDFSSIGVTKTASEVAMLVGKERNIFSRPSKVLENEDFVKVASAEAVGQGLVFLGLMLGLSVGLKKEKLTDSILEKPDFWMKQAPLARAQAMVLEDKDNKPTDVPPWSSISTMPPRYGHPYNLVDGIMPVMHRTSDFRKQSSDFLVKKAYDCFRRSFLLSLASFFSKKK